MDGRLWHLRLLSQELYSVRQGKDMPSQELGLLFGESEFRTSDSTLGMQVKRARGKCNERPRVYEDRR